MSSERVEKWHWKPDVQQVMQFSAVCRNNRLINPTHFNDVRNKCRPKFLRQFFEEIQKFSSSVGQVTDRVELTHSTNSRQVIQRLNLSGVNRNSFLVQGWFYIHYKRSQKTIIRPFTGQFCQDIPASIIAQTEEGFAIPVPPFGRNPKGFRHSANPFH